MTLTKEALTKDKIKEIIAKRIAKEFKNNDIVTLGIGLPTEAANYVPEGVNIIFQSEMELLVLEKTNKVQISITRLLMLVVFVQKLKMVQVFMIH